MCGSLHELLVASLDDLTAALSPPPPPPQPPVFLTSLPPPPPPPPGAAAAAELEPDAAPAPLLSAPGQAEAADGVLFLTPLPWGVDGGQFLSLEVQLGVPPPVRPPPQPSRAPTSTGLLTAAPSRAPSRAGTAHGRARGAAASAPSALALGGGLEGDDDEGDARVLLLVPEPGAFAAAFESMLAGWVASVQSVARLLTHPYLQVTSGGILAGPGSL